jgi:hypothetical protein
MLLREHHYNKKTMSKLKITDNTTKPLREQIEIGQFYKDTNPYGNNGIYIVAQLYNTSNICEFVLVEINTGKCYTNSTLSITDVFADDIADFEPIENIEIIIS